MRSMALGRWTAAVLAIGVVRIAGAGDGAAPNPAWDAMKSLQGTWDGRYAGKDKARVSYRLVSNGTALMETLVTRGSGEMITMYHPDGNRLAMTHYCSENTQSRMRAPADDGKRIAFSYLDATNLPSADAMRMTGLVVTLRDRNHFTQEWTSTANGKSTAGRFEFRRRPSPPDAR